MTSPVANGHPTTPPTTDPAVQTTSANAADPDVPLTSLNDPGQSRRPRDARLIHLVLSSLGIHSYQERVPLQLLDFAYRYTSSVLSDSLRLSGEGYSSNNAGQTDRGGNAAGKRGQQGAGAEDGTITVTALRQAIASRTGYHFQGPLPKEFMLEQAAERNRLSLPKVERSAGGLMLPPEKYCLTGVGWNLKDEWDSEEDVSAAGENGMTASAGATAPGGGDVDQDERMGGMDGPEDEEDEEGAGRMEDVFGEEGGGEGDMVED